MTNVQSISSPRQHYVALDCLRGVAAFIVLVYHYMEAIYFEDYSKNILAHGFLAVDFFFCLSGFVIGYAYDERMQKVGIRQFFRNRLIRLHPLVIFAAIIGLVGYFLDPFSENLLASGWKNAFFAFIFSCLLLPVSVLPNRPELFPFNPPSWSLFFEYLANIVYAFVLCRIKKGWLILLGVLSAAGLVYCAQKSGWLIGGWSFQSIPDGFARVGFSFIAGLLVYRFNFIWKHRLGILLPVVLLLGVFFFPHRQNDWLVEVTLVIVVFPLLVALGAGTSVTGKAQKICDFIGRISYPLYMTHYVIVGIFWNYYNMHHPSGSKLWLIVWSLVILNLIIAYVSMRWIDEPVRKWLNKRKS